MSSATLRLYIALDKCPLMQANGTKLSGLFTAKDVLFQRKNRPTEAGSEISTNILTQESSGT